MRFGHRRNTRKSSVNAHVAGPFAMILVVVISGMGVRLAMRNHINVLAEQIRKEEARRPALESSIQRAQARWSECADPMSVSVALARHGLSMQTPRGEQIVMLQNTMHGAKVRETTSIVYDKR